MSAAPKVVPIIAYDLEVIKGPHAGQKFSFDKVSVTLGRGTENQVVLSQDLRVSRVHAEIRNSDGQIFFVNLSQKNYVLVDGTKVEFQQISADCILTIGETEIHFRQKTVQPKKNPLVVANPSHNMVKAPPPFVPRPMPSAQFPQPQPAAANSNRMRFFLIVGIIGVAAYFLLFNSPKKSKKGLSIRGSEVIERDLQDSQERIEILEARVNKKNSLTNKRAEENFIKGFRDYQKGQYLRAKEYFRIVLNLNPEHIEARKYYEQAMIKHRKLMEFNFIEGLKSKEKKNYRLCKSFLTQVLVLAQGDRASYEKYEEAEKYLRECNLGLEGRF
ncbi:MAG: FHA domain-containing protein [Bdellovibrionota bacterium]